MSSSIDNSLIFRTQLDFNQFDNPKHIFNEKVQQHRKIVTDILNHAKEACEEKLRLERRIKCYSCVENTCGCFLCCLTCPFWFPILFCAGKWFDDCAFPFSWCNSREGALRDGRTPQLYTTGCCSILKVLPLIDRTIILNKKLDEALFVADLSHRLHYLNSNLIDNKLKHIEHFKDSRFMKISYRIWFSAFSLNDLLEKEYRENNNFNIRNPGPSRPIFKVFSDEFVQTVELTIKIQQKVEFFFSRSNKSQLPKDLVNIIQEYIIEYTNNFKKRFLNRESENKEDDEIFFGTRLFDESRMKEVTEEMTNFEENSLEIPLLKF